MFNDEENQFRWNHQRDYAEHRRNQWLKEGRAVSRMPSRRDFDSLSTPQLLAVLSDLRSKQDARVSNVTMVSHQIDAVRSVLQGRMDA